MPTMSLREAANGLENLTPRYDYLYDYADPAVQYATPQAYSQYIDWQREAIGNSNPGSFGIDYSPYQYWSSMGAEAHGSDSRNHMGDAGKKVNHFTYSSESPDGGIETHRGFWAPGQQWPQNMPQENMLRYYTRYPNTFWPSPDSPYSNEFMSDNRLLGYFQRREQTSPYVPGYIAEPAGIVDFRNSYNVMPSTWSGPYFQ